MAEFSYQAKGRSMQAPRVAGVRQRKVVLQDNRIGGRHLQHVKQLQREESAAPAVSKDPAPAQLKKNRKKRALTGATLGGTALGLGGLALGATALANVWNPIGWGLLGAGIGALAGGALGYATGKPKNLEERFDYDSDTLSDEDLSDAEEDQELVRAPGKRDETRVGTKVYSPVTAVKRTARSIRRFRKGTATEADKKPILTRIASQVLEMAPTHWRKDVGVYRTDAVEGGGRKRVGSAKPYSDLAHDLDTSRDGNKLSAAEMDQHARNALMGHGIPKDLAPDVRENIGELAGVLMSDMARGSAGPSLIDKMLSIPASFKERFADKKGTYRPAWKQGGSKFIQEESKERKKDK